METENTLLEFLDQSDINIFNDTEIISTKIQDTFTRQQQKQTQILSIKEEVSKIDIPALNKKNKKENYINQIDTISNNISSNINDLTFLKEIWENSINEFYRIKDYPEKESAINLKNMISTYKNTSTKVELNILTTDNTIEEFIKDLAKIDKTLNFTSKVSTIEDDSNVSDNNTLIISEKDNCVFLPYTVDELNSYLVSFPNDYTSLTSVINKEFVLPLKYFSKHPSLARFREAYTLIRDREAKSVFEALKYSSNLMLKSNLNPAIISACRTENTLNHYVDCLENNKLDNFDTFKIEYRVNPFKTHKQ